MKPIEFFSTKTSFTLFTISGIGIFWKLPLGTLVFVIAMLLVEICDIIPSEHILLSREPNILVSVKNSIPKQHK